MKKISFNWTKGGMAGGLRMASANVERVASAHDIDWQTRLLAAEISAKLISLRDMLAAQKVPAKEVTTR